MYHYARKFSPFLEYCHLCAQKILWHMCHILPLHRPFLSIPLKSVWPRGGLVDVQLAIVPSEGESSPPICLQCNATIALSCNALWWCTTNCIAPQSLYATALHCNDCTEMVALLLCWDCASLQCTALRLLLHCAVQHNFQFTKLSRTKWSSLQWESEKVKNKKL